MKINVLETVTGALVILISAALLFFGYASTQHSGSEGYKIIAKFSKADGLNEGSDIKIGGIRVGTVAKLRLDPNRYTAIVEMLINKEIKLPTDTSASIISESLLGGKYLDLQPGGDEEMLKDGEEISHTQSSVILESLIGQFIFNSKDDKSKKTKKAS